MTGMQTALTAVRAHAKMVGLVTSARLKCRFLPAHPRGWTGRVAMGMAPLKTLTVGMVASVSATKFLESESTRGQIALSHLSAAVTPIAMGVRHTNPLLMKKTTTASASALKDGREMLARSRLRRHHATRMWIAMGMARLKIWISLMAANANATIGTLAMHVKFQIFQSALQQSTAATMDQHPTWMPGMDAHATAYTTPSLEDDGVE